MGVEENKAVVRSFYEAGNRGEFDTCFDLLADDIVWTNIGTTSVSGTYSGKQQLMEELLGPLFARLRAGISSEIEMLLGEGDRVVALTSGTAETIDGQPYNNTYCQVIRLRDGKFAEVREYFDTQLAASIFGSA